MIRNLIFFSLLLAAPGVFAETEPAADRALSRGSAASKRRQEAAKVREVGGAFSYAENARWSGRSLWHGLMPSFVLYRGGRGKPEPKITVEHFSPDNPVYPNARAYLKRFQGRGRRHRGLSERATRKEKVRVLGRKTDLWERSYHVKATPQRPHPKGGWTTEERFVILEPGDGFWVIKLKSPARAFPNIRLEFMSFLKSFLLLPASKLFRQKPETCQVFRPIPPWDPIPRRIEASTPTLLRMAPLLRIWIIASFAAALSSPSWAVVRAKVKVRVAPNAAGAAAAAGAGVRMLVPVNFDPMVLPVLPALANPMAAVMGSRSNAKAESKAPSSQRLNASRSHKDVPMFEASAVGDAPVVKGKPSADTRREAGKEPPTAAEGLKETSKDLDRPGERERLGHLSAIFDGTLDRHGTPAVRTRDDHSAIAAKTRPKRKYLTETEGFTGAQLLGRLHEISRRGYRSHGYQEARKELFSNTDNFKKGGRRGVVAAYSDVFIEGRSGDGTRYGERGDLNGDGFNDRGGMNVEHLWPQSYFNQRSPMRSDLHHLMATFAHPNSERSRYPFGEVPGNRVEYHNNAGAKLGAGLFEPPDTAKGRVARGLLYFYMRYHKQNILPHSRAERFWDARIDTLMRWNRDFPPDAFESRRNDLVEEYQGNRNPFVDDYTLVDKIGAENFRMKTGRSRRQYVEADTDAFSEFTARDFTRETEAAQTWKKGKRKKKKKRGHRKKNRKRDRR